MPAYVSEVRERQRRVALAELRTGVHWGAEELARLQGRDRPPPDQRFCVHCASAGQPGQVENTLHIVYRCSLYTDLRAIHPRLFPVGQPQQEPPSLGGFLSGPAAPLASFVGACRRRARRALGLPP